MLHTRIRELRRAKGMTQVDLAKVLGVTKQSVSNWENDNIQPSIEMLVRLAQFFSVTTDYLLGLDGQLSLCVTGLTPLQIAHIQAIVSDLLQSREASLSPSSNAPVPRA